MGTIYWLAFIVLLILGVLCFLLIIWPARKAMAELETIAPTLGDIRNGAKARKILSGARAEILSISDTASEVDWIIAQTNKWTDAQLNNPTNRSSKTAIQRRLRVLVNFHRLPRDLGNSELQNAVLRLLDEGFHLLWVYGRNASNFRDGIESVVKRFRHEDASRLLRQCGFVEMNDEEERVPVNFTLAAPFDMETLVYITFPSDADLNVVLKVVDQPQLTSDFDNIARRCLDRLRTKADFAKESEWQELLALLQLAKPAVQPVKNSD